jgi:hypothetical protein
VTRKLWPRLARAVGPAKQQEGCEQLGMRAPPATYVEGVATFGHILLTSFRDDILMQLEINLAGILLMMGVAGLLTWYKANNVMHSDAAIAASTKFEARRRSVCGHWPDG